LRHRDRTGKGQVVDVALTETVFGLLEAVVPEAVHTGEVRGPSGPTITGVAPTNAYPSSDGRQVVIGANSPSTWRRLCKAIGRPEMAEDRRYKSNADRWERRDEVDAAVAEWTSQRSAEEVVAACVSAGVPAGPIQTAADLLADPQLRARGMFEEVEAALGPVTLPALGPRLVDTPGRTTSAGPALGAHTRAVLAELGLDTDQVTALEEAGVVESAEQA